MLDIDVKKEVSMETVSLFDFPAYTYNNWSVRRSISNNYYNDS